MSEIFETFNGLSDQERYDIINSLQGSLEDTNWSNEASPMVAIKTGANWEWGVSGAGRPHSALNLVGTLTLSDKTDQYDRHRNGAFATAGKSGEPYRRTLLPQSFRTIRTNDMAAMPDHIFRSLL